MLLTAMHDNPNQGFWQANAKNNPPCHYQRKYSQSGQADDPVLHVFREPERQCGANTDCCRDETDADQQQIAIHNISQPVPRRM